MASDPATGGGHSSLILFAHGKIAGAHKSSPAAGKEHGCGCDGAVLHAAHLTEKMVTLYPHPFENATGKWHFFALK